MAISLISSANALDFNFTSPESVDLNEEFKVKIELETDEIYDVKIFVHENDKTISQILAAEWRNPARYLISAFPSESEFSVRLIQYSDNAEICVRLRKTNKTNFEESCKPIKVLETEDDESEEEDSDTDNEELEEEDENNDDEDEKEIAKESTNISLKPQIVSLKETPQNHSEKIVLSSKKQPDEAKVLITKYEREKFIILYAFIILCIFIIILLALKKL